MALLMHSSVYLVLIFFTRVFPILDNVGSYWTKKLMNDSQEACLLTLRHGQYMAMVERNCFWLEKCTAQSHAVYAIP